VFPFFTKEKKKVAIRCWVADIGDAKHRSSEISKYLGSLNNPYFSDFRYCDNALLINGVKYPVVVMDWVEGKPLKEFINDNIGSQEGVLLAIAEEFKNMVAYFHQQNIAHGDLQHGNILVKPDGKLSVIDYDSMYIKPLDGMTDTIKGLPGYQHPARVKNKIINHKLDYFSELVIYLSLLAYAQNPALWNTYYETEDLFFSKEDFANPGASPLIIGLSKSRNSMVVQLTQKLKEQLMVREIDELSPLEDLLVNKLEVAKEGIVDKWSKQPNKAEKKQLVKPDLGNILGKF
jgi:serine/threonine protein kinase